MFRTTLSQTLRAESGCMHSWQHGRRGLALRGIHPALGPSRVHHHPLLAQALHCEAATATHAALPHPFLAYYYAARGMLLGVESAAAAALENDERSRGANGDCVNNASSIPRHAWVFIWPAALCLCTTQKGSRGTAERAGGPSDIEGVWRRRAATCDPLLNWASALTIITLLYLFVDM